MYVQSMFGAVHISRIVIMHSVGDEVMYMMKLNENLLNEEQVKHRSA